MRLNNTVLWGAAMVVLALVLGLVLLERSNLPGGGRAAHELTLYCAAGVKPPVVDAAKAFEASTGVRVNIEFGGSGTLLSRITAAPRGDLYVAADSSYTDLAKAKALVSETMPLAILSPVIAVAKGNPKHIAGLNDLSRDDVRVSLGNSEAASIGKLSKALLSQSGHWERVHANVLKQGVYKPTVPEVAMDVALGAVDGAIIWDATVIQFKSLEAVHPPQWNTVRKSITLGVLKASTQQDVAKRFVDFLVSDAGRACFAKRGYQLVGN